MVSLQGDIRRTAVSAAVHIGTLRRVGESSQTIFAQIVMTSAPVSDDGNRQKHDHSKADGGAIRASTRKGFY